jgi:hypothetical protein
MEREILVAAAKELNDVLGLSPAMNLKASKKELLKQFKANLEEILPEDTFSKETTKVITHFKNKAKKVEDEVEVEDQQEEEITSTKEMKNIRIKQEEVEVQVAEREVVDFEESFDKALEEEMKGPKKKTLKQKKEAEKSEQAKANKLLVLEKRAFVAELIKANKFTKAEIMEKALIVYPDWKPVSLSTMITDGSNPRYNVFDSLVLKDKDTKILSFAKEG